jgi:hypothetical protein
MAKRIVQMLVTCAVETDLTRDAQEEIEGLLATSWPSVIVELVGSRVHGHTGSATSETGEK